MDEMSPEEKALAEEGLRRGVLTDEQIRQSIQIRDQMRGLGLEADLGKALLEKRHLTQEQLSALTAHIASGTCFRHPDRAAVSQCDRCGRPLCADCVIRVGTMTLCGENCAAPEEERPASPEVSPAEGSRWRWIVLGLVVGAGVLLTFVLWFLGRHLTSRADYDAYKELLAKKQYGGGQEQREVDLLEKIVARWPKESSAHVHLARSYRRAGETDRAVRLLLLFLKRRPENAEARMELALSYLALRDFAKAREELEELLKRQPKHAEAARELATLLVKYFPREVEENERAVRASLDLQPEDRLLRYHLAKICRQRNKAAEAAKEMKEILEPPEPALGKLLAREASALSGPSGSDIYLLAAELKVDESKPAAAIPLLEGSLKRNAGNVPAGALLARLYLRSDQAEKAGKVLADLSKQVPSDPRVWEALAECDLAAGRLDAYLKDLRKLYALRPDDEELAMKFFEAQLNARDLKGAGLLLEEMTSRGDKRALELRARLALEEGRTAEAQRLLQEIAATNPGDPSVTVMLARMERAAGNFEKAARMLSEVIRGGRADPGLAATARVHLGLALWQGGDARAAATEFEGVLSGGGPKEVASLADKLLKLARGQVPDESAVEELSRFIGVSMRADEVPRGVLGMSQLAWAKSVLSAAAFGKGPGTRPTGRVPGRKRRESRWTFLRRCGEEAARSEVAVARALAERAEVGAPQSLARAESLASAGGDAAEAVSLALAAQLDMVCHLLEREGMKPASEFLRRKSAAFAAVQESPEAEAAAIACVLTEGFASMLSAGQAGWAYKRAARNVVNGLCEAYKGCGDSLEQMRIAERAHVLLLNMFALRRRDAKLMSGP